MSLTVDIQKSWKSFSLNVRFSCNNGETLGILGTSGSGKSMTLRCIAGLITPDSGCIELNGRTLFCSKTGINIKPRERNIGYMFQNYALFPHMSVLENVCAALTGTKRQKRTRGEHLLAQFGLEAVKNNYPSQLSGGQQQRVALARCLATEPTLLLLDEPFSALDAHLREGLGLEMRRRLATFSGPSVLVTHSRDEAYKLSQESLFIENGHCLGIGATHEIFENPQTLAIARLTGCKNFSRATVAEPGFVHAVDWGVRLPVANPLLQNIAYVGVRAHHFEPCTQETLGAIPVKLLERVDAPFETDFLFQSLAAKTGECGTIWWKCKKDPLATPPSHLCVPSKQILLLREDKPL